MESIGDLLRAEREKKGLSIKEIETAISIRALYINAIEEGNYNIVPGEVYLKGFIRNYANYLGLNGQEIVASYRLAQQPIVPEVDNTPLETPTKTRPTNTNTTSNSNPTNSSKKLLVGVLAVCILGSAWWLFGSPSQNKNPQEVKQVQPTPSPTTTPTPAQPKAPVQNKPVVVIAKFTEQCWTAVVVDDKQIYEGIPQVGETITWEAQKNITITAGNANGIDIIHNGQTIGKIGKKGEVVVKTYLAKQ